MLASSPGHSQILPRSSGEKKKKTTFLHSCEKKIMKWPGNEDIVKWLTPSDLVIISLLSSPSATRFSPEGCDRYASNVTYMHACMEQISAMAIQGNLSVCTKQNKQTILHAGVMQTQLHVLVNVSLVPGLYHFTFYLRSHYTGAGDQRSSAPVYYIQTRDLEARMGTRLGECVKLSCLLFLIQ